MVTRAPGSCERRSRGDRHPSYQSMWWHGQHRKISNWSEWRFRLNLKLKRRSLSEHLPTWMLISGADSNSTIFGAPHEAEQQFSLSGRLSALTAGGDQSHERLQRGGQRS